ncbi:MAG: sodium:calcium antiporter [Candidatus Omnitrophica bacterium]|nr:sodium:calcium antiporter [Candidatus Omnitrophota bacterium]
MLNAILFLLLSLAMILLAAEGFTNAIEVIGRRLSFSQAVVGSILAAVGTALPETILPLVAIFAPGAHQSKEIGVGAILGAPFMLATIGFFLVGVSAIIASKRAGRVPEVRAEHRTLKRDLKFFLVMYSSAVFLPIAFGHGVTTPLAFLLGAGYIFYVMRTMAGDSAALEHFEGLHIIKMPVKWGLVDEAHHHIAWAFLQVAVALVLMVFGAQVFVQNMSVVSAACGMSPLLFALLVAPIATELPEKFNSVTWTLKGKDTLAVGNMTGAMVFQSTFPVSVGLLFTPWKVEGLALVSAVLALLSAAFVLYAVTFRRRVDPWVMILGGTFYVAYAAWVIFVK